MRCPNCGYETAYDSCPNCGYVEPVFVDYLHICSACARPTYKIPCEHCGDDWRYPYICPDCDRTSVGVCVCGYSPVEKRHMGIQRDY